MNALMSGGTGLSIFACSAEECLSWIIILLNILTVFYLVFCAWYKVTKGVKVIGYVWASVLAVGTVAVVAIHTCLFTILSAVFSALIIMAVLSVVLNKGILANVMDGEEKQKKPLGCYVIHKTDKENFCFLLYDDKKVAIAKSWFKYNSIDEAKAAIEDCRNGGRIASVEDKTKSWIEFVNHPKFELSETDGKYSFVMSLTSESKIIHSESFGEYEQCEKTMQTTLSAVLSDKIYFAEREVLADGQFEEKSSPVIAEDKKEEVAVTAIEEPKAPVKKKAKPVKATPVKEEPPVTEEVKAVTLSESLKLAEKSTKNETISKKYIADYLESKYGKKVIVNRRALTIKSGKLPLADTHYVVDGKNKACFAFVYETNGNVVILLNATKELGKKFAKGHKTVNPSLFPKSQDKWFSIVVDDSFKCEDVDNMLNESYNKVKADLVNKVN